MKPPFLLFIRDSLRRNIFQQWVFHLASPIVFFALIWGDGYRLIMLGSIFTAIMASSGAAEEMVAGLQRVRLQLPASRKDAMYAGIRYGFGLVLVIWGLVTIPLALSVVIKPSEAIRALICWFTFPFATCSIVALTGIFAYWTQLLPQARGIGKAPMAFIQLFLTVGQYFIAYYFLGWIYQSPLAAVVSLPVIAVFLGLYYKRIVDDIIPRVEFMPEPDEQEAVDNLALFDRRKSPKNAAMGIIQWHLVSYGTIIGAVFCVTLTIICGAMVFYDKNIEINDFSMLFWIHLSILGIPYSDLATRLRVYRSLPVSLNLLVFTAISLAIASVIVAGIIAWPGREELGPYYVLVAAIFPISNYVFACWAGWNEKVAALIVLLAILGAIVWGLLIAYIINLPSGYNAGILSAIIVVLSFFSVRFLRDVMQARNQVYRNRGSGREMTQG